MPGPSSNTRVHGRAAAAALFIRARALEGVDISELDLPCTRGGEIPPPSVARYMDPAMLATIHPTPEMPPNHDRWLAYRPGVTVREVLGMGITPLLLTRDHERGYITITPPGTTT